MKRLMITAALVAGLATMGFSQENAGKDKKDGVKTERADGPQKTPEQRAKMATDALDKKLTLTAEQKTQVYALNLERAQKMALAMNSDMADRKEAMKNNRAQMEETERKLGLILTAEQKKSYEAMKAESREKMKAKQGGKGPEAKGKKAQ